MARITAVRLSLLATVLLPVLWMNTVSAQDYRVQRFTCANANFTYQCPNDLVISILSLTIYSNIVNPAPIMAKNNNTCPSSLHNCSRTFKDVTDQGLNDLVEYAYFYKWMFITCQGKNTCNGTMPAPDRLHGINSVCSTTDVAYFVAVLLDSSCVQGMDFSTFAPLPVTTVPITEGTSKEATEIAPILVPIESGALTPKERILIAVLTCAAIIGLFLLLLLLYCCDKWRREKKKMSMLLRLGKPEEKLDAIDEIKEFAAREAWMHETEHPEALGEYCGVKPEEVFTINRKTMDRSDKARQDGAATLQRGYATLQRGVGGGSSEGYTTMQRGSDMHNASSVTTLVRAAADKEYINNAYIPPTFERMDMLHY